MGQKLTVKLKPEDITALQKDHQIYSIAKLKLAGESEAKRVDQLIAELTKMPFPESPVFDAMKKFDTPENKIKVVKKELQTTYKNCCEEYEKKTGRKQEHTLY